jgi:hypothetical protein
MLRVVNEVVKFVVVVLMLCCCCFGVAVRSCYCFGVVLISLLQQVPIYYPTTQTGYNDSTTVTCVDFEQLCASVQRFTILGPGKHNTGATCNQVELMLEFTILQHAAQHAVQHATQRAT